MHRALGIAITLLTLSANQAAFSHDPFERTTLAWLNETEPDVHNELLTKLSDLLVECGR